MRSDRTRGEEFLNADSWAKQKYRDSLFVKLPGGPPFFKSNSFSGHEPNNLFLNDDGQKFHDLTLISGADHDGDGRGFAKLDFDQDGWLDIALVSTNWPRFRLYKNQLGASLSNQRLRIRLEGANMTALPSRELSNRDGIGAKVFVHYESGRKALKHRQVGEGNVAQNSNVIWVGFEPADPVVKIQVLWPSGASQEVTDLPTENVILVREPATAPKLLSN